DRPADGARVGPSIAWPGRQRREHPYAKRSRNRDHIPNCLTREAAFALASLTSFSTSASLFCSDFLLDTGGDFSSLRPLFEDRGPSLASFSCASRKAQPRMRPIKAPAESRTVSSTFICTSGRGTLIAQMGFSHSRYSPIGWN